MKSESPIAVVGMAGIFPGAKNIDIFWHNLIQKIDPIAEVPDKRWVAPPYDVYTPSPAPDKAYSLRMGLVDPIKFDCRGTDLDEDLMANLDPLYHMVLETGKTALETCNLTHTHKNRIGVSLAAIALPTDGSTQITRYITEASFNKALMGEKYIPGPSLSKNLCLGAQVTALPAALLAHALNLGGGTFTLDAACASSIYAVKLACDELVHYKADAMLAGGVSRPDALFTQVGFSQLRALSPSGRCAPFDESADGLVVGEGAGMLVLKRLEDAVRDEDSVYGVIRGIGLSNDTRGNLLAPDSEGQLRAMENAYDTANWSPTDVDYIECHGAGTPVGDIVELTSLCRLWESADWQPGQCPIGSVKSAVGHLLTGAGAAGIIKTLLGFQHETLPPSFHFSRAPKNSPLHGSPFHVRTEAAPWKLRNPDSPRRAAVSAFGFGGINAHLLIEQWAEHKDAAENTQLNPIHFDTSTIGQEARSTISIVRPKTEEIQVAIVGMNAFFGPLTSLREFQEAVFKGDIAIRKRPSNRWRGCDDLMEKRHGLGDLPGAYADDLKLGFGEFHIPPNEIMDILPQQLLMLKVASDALRDAEMTSRQKRLNMGAVIGIGFDFETTHYHLRWHIYKQTKQWHEEFGLGLTKQELAKWQQDLMNQYGPPLTSTRTIGNLGSIVASRIAREFQFGGPSFSVSNEAASGLKALEIGIQSLQEKNTDAVLVGAVDFFGDARNLVSHHMIRPFSADGTIRPFDSRAGGTLPGEGASALIIKRLEDAVADKDRIYAVIKGIGKAGGPIHALERHNTEKDLEETYFKSLRSSLENASVAPDSITYFETHGSGDPDEDRIEASAISRLFDRPVDPGRICALGSVKPIIGHTGAAAGLASVVKTALCLYQEILPPLPNFEHTHLRWQSHRFHMPKHPQYWLKDKSDGPRRAITGAMAMDGNCMHVVMEEASNPTHAEPARKIRMERKKPAGLMPCGLFIIEAFDKGQLVEELERFSAFVSAFPYHDLILETVARKWYNSNLPDRSKRYAVALVVSDGTKLNHWIQEAIKAVLSDTAVNITGPGGCAYFPSPLNGSGKIAFVFPGSGNHYLGMGREIGVLWPEVFRDMAGATDSLKSQMRPQFYMPWRMNWQGKWEQASQEAIVSDPLTMIFGQVVHGAVMNELVSRFGIRPQAVIGYSLGQSAGYFALKVWPDREEMLVRMMNTDLFTKQLAGPCSSAKKIWRIPDEENVNWCAAVVNRSADIVKTLLPEYPTARLLIVNTPDQCVVGGRKPDVIDLIDHLNCESVFLDGVVTVHCDAALPAASDYRALHLFPVTPPAGITFYSCAHGVAQDLTTETAADSILKQALEGFDFPKTIAQAYQDGVRIFLEMGPHASCTGMIRAILADKPHLAVSACFRGESPYLTLIKFLGTLLAHRLPVNLASLYADEAYPSITPASSLENQSKLITVPVGGKTPSPSFPGKTAADTLHNAENNHTDEPFIVPSSHVKTDLSRPFDNMIQTGRDINEAVARTHQMFLALSTDVEKNYAQAFELQNRLLHTLLSDPNTDAYQRVSSNIEKTNETVKKPLPKIAFSRDMCMEFAVGSAAKVMGPEFAVIDTYDKRVRLPDEPLMLVDRILSIEGDKLSLSKGRIVTEHDVLPGAWYLDGGKAPVCISVEAGQADLFLCSWLGIDHKVKGKRAYRLLDATVEFHRGLPEPGDTIRYEIEIDKFVRQGETYLFFFHFKGFIKGIPLITMTNGCAGFFTDEEVRNSGGILLTEEEKQSAPVKSSDRADTPIRFEKKALADHQLAALRNGDLAQCFGPDFDGVILPENLRIPNGPMNLIHRILALDPHGGRYGLGLVRAEADIHPDDWFLTCHFVDDMVMPGTLMYECCAHTLRVLLQQMGWVSDKAGLCYEPVKGTKAVLKCRGPVRPSTRHVHYEVEIKEMGYGPEPYVLADAHMYADGHYIVKFIDMSMKLSNLTREELYDFWQRHTYVSSADHLIEADHPLFSRADLVEFALGEPSKVFGSLYTPFDRDRFIARLPNPPYLFIDEITRSEPAAWELKPDGWITATYKAEPSHWYFAANRNPTMPYAVLLEIALQPCGFLAAFMGSALKSDEDLKFRNLGGKAVLHKEVYQEPALITTKARLMQVSTAGGMIIEQFEFIVSDEISEVYSGQTTFGFFTASSLARQAGIRDAAQRAYTPTSDILSENVRKVFDTTEPLLPQERLSDRHHQPMDTPAMPAKAILMVDQIDTWLPHGGHFGLGYIRGIKAVDPDEWFFKAHFYQDPVCPGSLGVESFLQLLKFAALEKWGERLKAGRFELVTGKAHSWTYRGQIVPQNNRVEVEAVITEIIENPDPVIMADGFLKVDGLYIYEMKDFGIKISNIF